MRMRVDGSWRCQGMKVEVSSNIGGLGARAGRGVRPGGLVRLPLRWGGTTEGARGKGALLISVGSRVQTLWLVRRGA